MITLNDAKGIDSPSYNLPFNINSINDIAFLTLIISSSKFSNYDYLML